MFKGVVDDEMVVSKKGARLKQPNTSSAGLEVQENRRPPSATVRRILIAKSTKGG